MATASKQLRLIKGADVAWNEEAGLLHCDSPHALVRAAGYLKHLKGQDGGRVVFRGESGLWNPCLPSIFRATKGSAAGQRVVEQRLASLDEAVVGLVKSKAFIRSRVNYDYAHQPLLQHYGVNTPWLDVVDNIWVALWFATHRCVSDTGHRHAHWHYIDSTQKYAYILLMSAGPGETPVEGKPGLFETDSCLLVDLRIAAPSLYVRPHAQHGLLLRRKKTPPRDYFVEDQCLGRIRIETAVAKSWLGSGFLHAPHVVFPPPHYDSGYNNLLATANAIFDGSRRFHDVGLGRIAHVFP